MSFFDDDAEATQVPSPTDRRRPRSNRSRLRIQRLVLALVVLFIVVFAAALIFRSCQQNARESAYRTYFSQVDSVIHDANAVGHQLGAVVADPTRPNNLKATLDALVAKQTEITTRAGRVSPPGKLDQLNNVFVDGMKVRLRGVQQMRDGLLAATNVKNRNVTARKLAALSGYFTGPDAYYQELFYTKAQQVMRDDGVSNVRVPPMDYFATHDLFSQSALANALSRVSSSAKLTGIHGVGLAGVAIKSNGKTTVLQVGKDNRFAASPDWVIQVTVENQGDVTETNVPVKVTWTPPDNSAQQPVTGTIATLAAHQKQTVDITGPTIGQSALIKQSHLKVQAGPVAGEKYLKNNVATYVITPSLQ